MGREPLQWASAQSCYKREKVGYALCTICYMTDGAFFYFCFFEQKILNLLFKRNTVLSDISQSVAVFFIVSPFFSKLIAPQYSFNYCSSVFSKTSFSSNLSSFGSEVFVAVIKTLFRNLFLVLFCALQIHLNQVRE